MGDIFLFVLTGFFSCILGLIVGGMFRVLIVENEAIESPFLRFLVFAFFFFPVYVPIIGFSYLIITGQGDDFGGMEYGILTGLLIGGSVSYKMAGRPSNG